MEEIMEGIEPRILDLQEGYAFIWLLMALYMFLVSGPNFVLNRLYTCACKEETT